MRIVDWASKGYWKVELLRHGPIILTSTYPDKPVCVFEVIRAPGHGLAVGYISGPGMKIPKYAYDLCYKVFHRHPEHDWPTRF